MMTEFKPGQPLEVDWSVGKIFCDNHTNNNVVVFIEKQNEHYARVAYPAKNCGISVGYVPYAALSEE